jgi:hypothetical protein
MGPYFFSLFKFVFVYKNIDSDDASQSERAGLLTTNRHGHNGRRTGQGLFEFCMLKKRDLEMKQINRTS